MKTLAQIGIFVFVANAILCMAGMWSIGAAASETVRDENRLFQVVATFLVLSACAGALLLFFRIDQPDEPQSPVSRDDADN